MTGQLLAKFSVASGLSSQVQPRPSGGDPATQSVGWRVVINGSTVLPADLVRNFTVDLRLGDASSWAFALPADDASNLVAELPDGQLKTLLGNILAASGPPTGLESIDIFGIAISDDAVHIVPLIINGLATNARRSQQAEGHFIELSGLGPEGRFDRKLITYKAPAGHNMPRSKVVQQLIEKLGATPGTLWASIRMNKEVQAVDEEGLALAKELADAGNQALAFDRHGNLSALPQVDLDGPILWDFEPQDLLMTGAVTSEGDNEGPTVVTVTSTEQVVNDEPENRIVVTVVEGFGNYGVRGAHFTQSGAGVLSSIGPFDVATAFILTSRVTTTTTYEGSTIVQRRVVTEGWSGTEVWRYRYDNTLTGKTGGGAFLDYHAGAYVYDSGGVADGPQPLFRDFREHFIQLAQVDEVFTYDSRGFLDTTVRVERQHSMMAQALKERTDPSEDWGTVLFIEHGTPAGSGVYARGNGQGVLDVRLSFTQGGDVTQGPPVQVLFVRKEITTQLSVNDAGFITQEVEVLREALARPGFDFWSHGGSESVDEAEVEQSGPADQRVRLHTSRRIVTAYSELTESLSLKSTVVYGPNGEVESIVNEEREGFLPAAPKLDTFVPPVEEFEDPADHALALAASTRDLAPIECEVTAVGLDKFRPPYEVIESFEWGESEDDICRRAATILALGAATRVTFTLPANWSISPGHRAHLRVPSAGLNHDLHVIQVGYSQTAPYDPITTVVNCRHYGLELK